MNIVVYASVKDLVFDKDGDKQKTTTQSLEMEMSTRIKKSLDSDDVLKDEGAGWHVVVGKCFAASVTSQAKFHIFFDLKEMHKSFLLFKTQ